MPLISTFAAASARGYGQFTPALNVTTVTFTSNGTWVVPSGVGEVLVLSGGGSPGVSDYTQPDSRTICAVLRWPPGVTTPITYTWQNLIDYCQGFVSTMNATSGVQAITVPSAINAQNGVRINNSNLGDQNQTTAFGQNLIYVGGGGNASLSFTSFPPSGVSASSTITYSDTPSGGSYIGLGFLAYIYGGPGSPATALGYSFPGGVYSGGIGYPSVGATYNNIPVTPGTSYSIVVPSGGSVSITYYT
jgi:hypothetical protein